MPSVAEIQRLRGKPETAYAEYDTVRKAARVIGQHVAPNEPGLAAEAAQRRGWDWCCSVLGFYYTGLRSVTVVEARMLLIADRMDLDPAQPPWLVEVNKESVMRTAAVNERRNRLAMLDQKYSDMAMRECTVPVEVRQNPHAGIRHNFPHNLAHAVPLAHAMSGKSRRHPAGRALCETEKRPRPLALGEPARVPVTCQACLARLPQIRAAS